MELVLALAGIFGVVVLLLILTHLRPLTEEEVRQLGTKRRSKQVRRYFSFERGEFSVSKEFKKRMEPSGRFYPISESLQKFPPVAAALLKYKKHEWAIIAFERNKEIFLIWLNKGLNRSSVSPYLSPEAMGKVADERGATSILEFHNHPNPDPNYLVCTKPSDLDLATAKACSSVLNERGLNLVSFVCERGRHYEYFLSPADTFLPLLEFVQEINDVNGQSRLTNLKLHIERMI